ncbi:hypothetical protein VaNZ11_006559 [Volvox africanus]|uniref:Integrase catalytic domain-containing protein n=1 Tax=Volvox africanus TaxID=51714 RepID=A0ABQ5S1N7_9CHLO|nr:hypothetical protein VaNZ11_006559 [Volvox africanus]
MSSASQVAADFASLAKFPDAPTFLASEAKSASLWHRRLGHLGLTNMKRLVQEGMVKGLEVTDKELREFEGRRCEPCILGKHARDPFPASEGKTQKALQLLHLDVCGPLPLSSCGYKYFVTMLDDYTGASLVQPIKEKSDVANFMERAITMLQVQSNGTLQCIRTDGGGEFVNRQVQSYCASNGVRHQLSAPYTPQQNGKAKRLNRTLLDKVRAMLAESAVPKEYWHEALMVANFVRNRSPVAGKPKTPYELLTGVVPDVSLLRVFGCVAYAHVPKGKCDKLDSRAQKGTFLGYEANSKAYRILLGDGRIQITRDVVFLEDQFAFSNHVRPELEVFSIRDGPSVPVAGAAAGNAGQAGGAGVVDAGVPAATHAAGAPAGNAGVAGVGATGGAPVIPAAGAPAGDAGVAGMDDGEVPPLMEDDDEGEEVDYGMSETDVGGDYGDDAGGDVASSSGSETGQGSSGHTEESGNLDPTPPRPIRQRKPPGWQKDYAMLASELEMKEPKSLEEAQSRVDWPQWKAAMDEEMASLQENRTWELEEIPMGARKIGLKWVFKLKRDADGNVERYKARLVAKGFTQKEGVDFGDVFAPVGKYASFRALLAVAADRDLELHQLDIKTAFLHGELKEEVYTEQPPGYNLGGPNVVCKLRRALYGLRQAPRAWYIRLRKELESMGFKPSLAEPGLFVKIENGEPVYVLVYVDDLLLACKSMAVIGQVKAQLLRAFAMRDLGETRFYLGFEIERDRTARTISVTQRRYISNILEKFGMKGANSRSTPMDANLRLTAEGDPLDTSVHPYSEVVGSLLYLAVCSRPDISFAVGSLARFMAKPTINHWNAAKGVMRYLKGTQALGIKFGGGAHVQGYCDSDLAGAEGRRSTTGFVYLLNGGAIVWSSKLQPTVATSTAEAEYMATAASIKDALWLRHLLHDLGVPVGVVPMKCDSTACIAMLESPMSTARTKHLDICHHFARERIERGEIRMVHCSTAEQLADMFTKSLPKGKFKFCVAGMGLR